jgi:enamine deaminase RidA (YjgF/YER057c/UK114 family)
MIRDRHLTGPMRTPSLAGARGTRGTRAEPAQVNGTWRPSDAPTLARSRARTDVFRNLSPALARCVDERYARPMTRTHAWPAGHWNWPIDVTHRHGVRQGDLRFVGGQVDLDEAGTVLHPGDAAAQAPVALAALGRVLVELESGLDELVKLVVYHVPGEGGSDALRAILADALPAPRPAITLVPLPYLAYPGMHVEIEGVAARGAKRRVGDGAFPDGIRCGDLVWTSALAGSTPGDIAVQSEEMMERLGGVLAALDAGFDDVVKFDAYYVGGGTAEDWEVAARVRARYYPEPGPAATGVPVPALDGDTLIVMDVWAMRPQGGSRTERTFSWPDGHWDWPIHLPYRHGNLGGGMFFVGGQVSLTAGGEVIDGDDLERQTHTAMRNIIAVLDDLGVSIDDVVKVTAFYEGDGGGDDLHRNLAIRSSYFTAPGPATTGISLPCLAYDGMVMEIEVIGMVRA